MRAVCNVGTTVTRASETCTRTLKRWLVTGSGIEPAPWIWHICVPSFTSLTIHQTITSK